MAGPSVLSATELERLERLAVAAARPSGGRYAGGHRSRARGRSLDVADWRAYAEGDDTRDIDVQAWARLDQLLVRLYEADVELPLQVIVDCSGSMAVGSKHHQACRVAASVAAVGLLHNESVGMMRLGERRFRRYRGRSALPALLAEVARWSPGGPSPLMEAARDLRRSHQRSGLTVVVSDFLVDDWDRALGLLGSRDQVLAFCIRSDADEPVDQLGELQLVDSETDEVVDIDLSPAVWAELVARREAMRAAVASRVASLGGRFVEVHEDADLLGAVVPDLLATGVVR